MIHNKHSFKPPVFLAENLEFSYDKKLVFSSLSITVTEGSAVAIVGPNGCGKTTLLKVLNGLTGPFRGKLEFLGEPMHKNRSLRTRSVYLHQFPVMFAGSVQANLAYPLLVRGEHKDRAMARAACVAEDFGLASLLAREANRLSGGETQRLALARAVSAGADVLLLDEPTSSMDGKSDDMVRSMLLMLKKRGTTLLFSSHDPSLVSLLADETYRMDGGILERKT